MTLMLRSTADEVGHRIMHMEEPTADPKNNPEPPPPSDEKVGPKDIQRWNAARKREVVAR